MTIVVAAEPIERVAEQAELSIAFAVDRVLEPTDGDGIAFTEVAVAEPWTKDYDAEPGEHGPRHWADRWDIGRWGFLVARDDGARVGGAVLAFDTAQLNMLRGRRDLAILWDVRVRPDVRRHGIGRMLWEHAEAWARARGCRHLAVETQNINVAACRFYERMGCRIGSIDRFAYWPELPNEIQVLWYKDL